MKNYYLILNIDINADKNVIKQAYKKMAMIWHPDRHLTNKGIAEEKFKEICEAYETLSDSNKKYIYDIQLSGKQQKPLVKINNIINDLFTYYSNNNKNIVNAKIDIFLTLDECYSGCKKDIEFDRISQCYNCKGYGIKNDDNFFLNKCIICEGNGFIIKINKQNMYEDCSLCKGTGWNLKNNVNNETFLCNICNGKKYINETAKLNINIPKGVYENYIMIIQNEGNIKEIINQQNNNRSDLEITFKEIKHKKFIREKNKSDLVMKMKISLAESLCGFSRNINFFNNETFTITNNKIIKNSNVYQINNRGMPIINTNNYGSLYIMLEIIYPENINIEAKKTIWLALTGEEYNVINDSNLN